MAHFYATHDGATDTDMAEVSLMAWHGAGANTALYAGPFSGATLRAIGANGRCGGCNAFPRCRYVQAED